MAHMKRMTGGLLATGATGITSYTTALDKLPPPPPVHGLIEVLGFAASGENALATITAILAGISAGYSIWQMFQPNPATVQDVAKDGRRTRQGLAHVSGQVRAEGQAADARHEELLARIAEVEAKLLAANPGGAQQIETFAETATTLAGSDDATDLAIAEKIASGDPLAASDRLLDEANHDAARAAIRARQAAQIAAPFSVAKAITAYARAVELDPAHFFTWIELSRLHQAAGSLVKARRTAECAAQVADDEWNRMVAEGTLGDIARDEGDLNVAATHYRSALAAAQALLAADPGNAGLQRDLSVSHDKLGDVARVAGNLDEARAQFAKSLAIRERLATADPGNAGWQRDLSVSHDKLGDVARDAGNLDEARTQFAKGLAIAERLAAADPGNAGWQRDLSVSHERLGDVAEAAGDLAEAVRCYEVSLPIAEHLAREHPDHPGLVREGEITRARLAALRARMGAG